MPTGFTYNVGDGTLTDFRDFAMQCARAFGALITMRDEPASAEIPEKFDPSDHHVKALDEAQARLAALHAMTIDQRQAAADKAHADAVKSWDDYEARKAVTRQRYVLMRAAVDDWKPPTNDHVELKNFMRQQLTDSIDHDCGPAYSPRPLPVKRDEWFAAAVEKAEHDVNYHMREHSKEIERAASRTAWVAALRKSLQAS